MKGLLRGLFGVSLFSVTLLSLDCANVFRRAELRASKEPGDLTITESHLSIPSCALERVQTIVGKPSLRANILEWLGDGNQRLIESARESIVAASEVEPDTKPFSYLVSFSDDGYEVKFDFAHLVPPRRDYKASGRDCPSGIVMPKPEQKTYATCEDLIAGVQAKIRQVTSTNSDQVSWYKYEYVEDFERLSLDFTPYYCVADQKEIP